MCNFGADTQRAAAVLHILVLVVSVLSLQLIVNARKKAAFLSITELHFMVKS